MCFKKHREALSRGFAKIAKIHRRKLPTILHEKAWMSYETILMYRTNCAFFMYFANDVIR